MEGVVRTTVGYAGGSTPSPTYRRIGDHTETIEVEFDPAVVSYEDLLDVFWSSHDPVRPAWSRQYRSAIFVHDDEQQRLAEATRVRIEQARGSKLQTSIEPAREFTRAEDYHQKYRLRGDRELMSEYSEMFPDADEFADSTAVARVNGLLGGNGGTADLERVAGELGLSESGLDRLRGIVERSEKAGFGRIFRCS